MTICFVPGMQGQQLVLFHPPCKVGIAEKQKSFRDNKKWQWELGCQGKQHMLLKWLKRGKRQRYKGKWEKRKWSNDFV